MIEGKIKKKGKYILVAEYSFECYLGKIDIYTLKDGRMPFGGGFLSKKIKNNCKKQWVKFQNTLNTPKYCLELHQYIPKPYKKVNFKEPYSRFGLLKKNNPLS